MRLICLLLISLLAVTWSAFSQAPAHELTEPHEIEVATELRSKLNAYSSKVTDCVKQGQNALTDCHCAAKLEMQALKEKYQVVSREHPDWSGKSINISSGSGVVVFNLDSIGKAIAGVQCK